MVRNFGGSKVKTLNTTFQNITNLVMVKILPNRLGKNLSVLLNVVMMQRLTKRLREKFLINYYP